MLRLLFFFKVLMSPNDKSKWVLIATVHSHGHWEWDGEERAARQRRGRMGRTAGGVRRSEVCKGKRQNEGRVKRRMGDGDGWEDRGIIEGRGERDGRGE